MSTLIPGVCDVPADLYHADDICDTPTLSAGVANVLVTRSPRHAWTIHPKLNPDYQPREDGKFDLGTAVHAILLQGANIIATVPFDDWRKAEAKELREAARQEGKVPLLAKDAERAWTMAEATQTQLVQHEARPIPFTDGKPEQTLVWTESNGVVCRARLDWLRDDHAAIDDLKTTSASADYRKWGRTAFGFGAEVQVAFYLRGCEKVLGVRPAWRYVVVETYPPYALSVVDLAPSALAIADDKVERAITLWHDCLEADHWPAYDNRVASLEIPTYVEMDWLERDGEVAA